MLSDHETQLKNCASEVENLRAERTKLIEQLRYAVEKINRLEGRSDALESVVDRWLDRLTTR